MAGRPVWRWLQRHLNLTRMSVVVGMVASIVSVLAVFGLIDGDDEDGPAGAARAEQPAPPIAGAVYAGRTGQGKPMHVRIYVDGRTIRDLTVPLEGECSDGGAFTTTYRQRAATTFVITGSVLSGSSTVTGRRGEIVDGIFRIDGRFSAAGRRVAGTASEHAVNREGETCDTPRVEFTATVESR